jgi:hypothetical protein
VCNEKVNDQERIGRVRRFMVEGFQAGNPNLVSKDCVDHQFGMAGTGADVRRKVKRAIVELKSCLPDLEYAFEDMHLCRRHRVGAAHVPRDQLLGLRPATHRALDRNYCYGGRAGQARPGRRALGSARSFRSARAAGPTR